MKNLLTFEEFLNENYNKNFLSEAREYYKEKNDPRLSAEYRMKVADIVEDIASAVLKIKGIQYAKNLTEIFGDEAKEWWVKGNPDWEFTNPIIGTIGVPMDDCKGYKARSEAIVFSGYDPDSLPVYSYDHQWISVFVKTKDVESVYKGWVNTLASIAKKHGISTICGYGEDRVSCLAATLGGKHGKPATDNPLWWSDENHGKTIEEKKPELGYSCLRLPFWLYLMPTPEEALRFRFKNPPKK